MSKNPAILYRVQWIETDTPQTAEDFLESDELESWESVSAPDGWAQHVAEMGWPADTEFFWPSTKRTYITREAAEGRASLINRWGGNAEVVVAVAEWLPIAEHDAEQERALKVKRIRSLKAELTLLENEIYPF